MSRRPTVAVCMIVRNEAANLPSCLGPIAPHVDEIVVVDTGSTDYTPDVARALGARVAHAPWTDDFSAARNESLRQATADWVLWLDADDRMDESEARKLRDLARRSGRTAYYCQLASFAASDLERSSCLQLRFFPRLEGVRFEGRIHEQVIYSLNRLGVEFCNCDVRIVHTGYRDRDVTRAKFARNLRLLELELAERPDDPLLLYHLAHSLNATGQLDRAVETLERLLAGPAVSGVNRPVYLYAHIVLARFQQDRGDLAAKVAVLRRALAEDPDYGLAHFFLGEHAWAERRLGEAREHLEHSLRAGIPVTNIALPYRPIEHLTRYYLAEIDRAEGRSESAAEHARAATALMPEMPQAWGTRADLAMELRRFDEAREVLERLLALGETHPTVHFQLGYCHLEQGRLGQARAAFAEVVRQDPARADAWLNLGNVEFREGRLEAAHAAYRQALRLRPNFALAQLNLAKTCLRLDRSEEAQNSLAAALEGNEPSGEALALVGDIRFRRGDYATARKAYETYLFREAPNPAVLLRLADCYLALGIPDAAELGYREVLRLDPRHEEAAQRLARLPAAADSSAAG